MAAVMQKNSNQWYKGPVKPVSFKHSVKEQLMLTVVKKLTFNWCSFHWCFSCCLGFTCITYTHYNGSNGTLGTLYIHIRQTREPGWARWQPTQVLIGALICSGQTLPNDNHSLNLTLLHSLDDHRETQWSLHWLPNTSMHSNWPATHEENEHIHSTSSVVSIDNSTRYIKKIVQDSRIVSIKLEQEVACALSNDCRRQANYQS